MNTIDGKRKTPYNSRFANAGVSCFYDSEVLNLNFVYLMKFSAEKPRLRQAAKRCASFYRHLSMNRTGKTRSVYFFKNTCHNCNNDIEFPLLGNFADYEFLMQTIDGKDFCIGVIVDNPTFDFVNNNLKAKELKDFQRAMLITQILGLLADKMHNKEFSKSYPICPICQELQTNYNDDVRTVVRDLNYASWNDFEKLSLHEKLIKLKEVASLQTPNFE